MSRELIHQKDRDRMKAIRELAGGLSQSKLSSIIGIDKEKIKSIENGRAKISVDIALALEKKLHLNFRWILTGEGTPTKKEKLTQASTCNESEQQDLLRLTEQRLKEFELRLASFERLMRAALLDRIRKEDSADQKDELLRKRVISSFLEGTPCGGTCAPNTP